MLLCAGPSAALGQLNGPSPFPHVHGSVLHVSRTLQSDLLSDAEQSSCISAEIQVVVYDKERKDNMI